MILFLSFLLLVVAPALLLWMGRSIAAIQIRDRDAIETDERCAEQASAGAWYRRPMLPAFAAQTLRHGIPAPEIAMAAIEGEDGREWFHRPMRPLIDWAALRRMVWRSRPRDQKIAGSSHLT